MIIPEVITEINEKIKEYQLGKQKAIERQDQYDFEVHCELIESYSKILELIKSHNSNQ
jgi:hypothetical protein